MRRQLFGILACLAIGTLYVGGALDFVEHRLTDLRFRLTRSDASADLVVVAIDARSLQELAVWPWPRSWHAEVIDRLVDAGAREIAIDIDFSARSTEAEDQRLEAALARAGQRVVLPVFRQADPRAEDSYVHTTPLPAFRRHVRTASVNIRPEPDGVVRRMWRREPWNDDEVPTLSALLGGSRQDETPFFIDFGIRPDSLARLSYFDVMAGRFDPARVAGRQVIIGATALELGDLAPVPLTTVMPGVMVQALAAQSLRQDRALTQAPMPLVLGVMALIVFAGMPLFRRLPWRWGSALFGGIVLAAFGAAASVQAAMPVMIDTAPWLMAALTAYGGGMAGRIDEQDLRLLGQSMVLRRKDALMRRVVEGTFDGLITLDAEGRVLSFNPAAATIFGFAEADAVGRPFGDLIAGDTADGVARLDALAEARQHREVEARRSDGATFPADIAVSRLPEDAAAAYVVLVRDIGARKAAEAVALRAQRRLADAIDSISEGFALFDAEERLVLSNERFRALHASVAHLIAPGRRFGETLRTYAEINSRAESPEAVARRVDKRLARFRNPGVPFEQRIEGGRWLLVSERRTGDGGVVSIQTDITEAKQRETELRAARDEARAASRSKSEFLATMSHELRTPLNAVMGFSEIMKDEMLGRIGNDTYRGYAGDIHASASHLLDVINDILDIARIEAGKLKLAESAVLPAAVADAAAGLIHERAASANVAFSIAVQRDLPALWADERLLKQILLNLLSNAVKFTPAGGRVELRVLVRAETGAVAFEVADTGIGIAAEDIPRVLRPFEQVDSSLNRRFEGTGLGLPLVKSMVDLHGGTFRLQSAVGIGTTAAAEFPPARNRPAAEAATRRPEPVFDAAD